MGTETAAIAKSLEIDSENSEFGDFTESDDQLEPIGEFVSSSSDSDNYQDSSDFSQQYTGKDVTIWFKMLY